MDITTYALAFQWRKTKIYEKLSAQQIVAVQINDGEVFYLACSGSSEEDICLNIYNDDGMSAMLRPIYTGMKSMDDMDVAEYLVSQNCLVCHFDDAASITKKQLLENRRAAGQLHYSLKKPAAYAVFTCAEPYKIPCPADSKKEKIIQAGLQAAIDLNAFLKTEEGKSFLIPGVTADTKVVPLLIRKGKRYVPGGTVSLPPFKKEVYPPAPSISEEDVNALKKLKKKGRYEMRIVWIHRSQPTEYGEHSLLHCLWRAGSVLSRLIMLFRRKASMILIFCYFGSFTIC